MLTERWLYLDRDPSLYREGYIGMFDLSKGILMLQIIHHHSLNRLGGMEYLIRQQPEAIQLLLSPLEFMQYGFIPMLFMICGYGVRLQPVKSCLRSTCRQLLPPWGCVTLAVLLLTLLKWLLLKGSLWDRLVYHVLPLLLGYHAGSRFFGNAIGSIGPLWFVLSYFLGVIYLNVLARGRPLWMQTALVAGGAALALCFTELPLPFCLQQVLICSSFLFLGMQMKRLRLHREKLRLSFVLAAVLLCVVASCRNGYVEFSINAFNRGGADVMVAGIAGLALFFLYLRLNVLQGMLPDGLRWMGRHMMWLCCIHTVSDCMLPWGRFLRLFGGHTALGILTITVINTVLAAGGCWLLEKIIKRRKFAFSL